MTENSVSNVSNTSAELIRKQREALRDKEEKQQQSKKKVVFDAKNYLDLGLDDKTNERKVTVRILPISSTNPGVFLMIHTHSMKVSKKIADSGFKSFICLNEEKIAEHDGRGCPMCNKAKELLKQSNAIPSDDKSRETERKALFVAGKQLEPKDTFIVRVIDRDHEDEGVKFWRFNAHTDGTGVYDQLMSIFDTREKESVKANQALYKIIRDASTGNETYQKVNKTEYDSLPEDERKVIPYNVFDLNNGKDFTITLKHAGDNKNRKTITIVDASYETPLSENPKQASDWINDPKTWNDLYAHKPYEYLEMVADGKIPVFDKENHKWIEKTDDDKKKDATDKAVEEAKKELETGKNFSSSTNAVDTTVKVDAKKEEEADDLPF